MFTLHINDTTYSVTVPADKPLLWVLRDDLQLTGAKFGCGEGLCGACTVLMDGEPVRSCVTTVEEAAGQKITTIEGLAADHPVKEAWLAEEVSQCGYCQPAMVLGTAALLAAKPQPSDQDIDQALSGHLCRCGSYPRVRKAIHRLSADKHGGDK